MQITLLFPQCINIRNKTLCSQNAICILPRKGDGCLAISLQHGFRQPNAKWMEQQTQNQKVKGSTSTGRHIQKCRQMSHPCHLLHILSSYDNLCFTDSNCLILRDCMHFLQIYEIIQTNVPIPRKVIALEYGWKCHILSTVPLPLMQQFWKRHVCVANAQVYYAVLEIISMFNDCIIMLVHVLISLHKHIPSSLHGDEYHSEQSQKYYINPDNKLHLHN